MGGHGHAEVTARAGTFAVARDVPGAAAEAGKGPDRAEYLRLVRALLRDP